MTPANKPVVATSPVEKLQRRSERIQIRLPIEAKGIDEDGKPFRERTHTLTINRHGGRIVLHRHPRPESRITVVNLQNHMACPFRVVERARKLSVEEAEWGVECLEPDIHFWGIYFPFKNEAAPADELIDVLLECTRCRFRALAQLSPDAYHTISTHSRLIRPCSKCRADTEWTFGFLEGNFPDPAPASSAPARPAPALSANRRRSKRVAVKLPVRVRMEEIGETENVSQGGVCFSSILPLKVGDEVTVTVGYKLGRVFREHRGRIVWRQATEGSPRALFGVQLEERRTEGR